MSNASESNVSAVYKTEGPNEMVNVEDEILSTPTNSSHLDPMPSQLMSVIEDERNPSFAHDDAFEDFEMSLQVDEVAVDDGYDSSDSSRSSSSSASTTSFSFFNDEAPDNDNESVLSSDLEPVELTVEKWTSTISRSAYDHQQGFTVTGDFNVFESWSLEGSGLDGTFP